jgi:hypothetical protein
MLTPDTVSSEEKQAALHLVLQSDTFARADQLKSFLRYVCDLEIAGEAAKITEYLIGVEALGRSEEFSPSDDTSVRNRAYVLRHKLEKFYEEECPSARVRIEFQKGTYAPRFVVLNPPAERPTADGASDQALGQASAPPLNPVPEAGEKTRRRMSGPRHVPIALTLTGALLGGLLMGAFAMHEINQRTNPSPAPISQLDPVIREAWGPLLGPYANVLLCVAAAAQLTVLPMDFKIERLEWSASQPPLEAPTAVYPWYRRYHPLQPGKRLFLSPDANSPHFGDVLGAMVIARVMTAAGTPFQFLPERLVPSATLNERNVVLFGAPHKSEAVSKLLEPGHFAFRYDPGLRDIFLSEKASASSTDRRFEPRRDERASRIESFGLITVQPSPGVEGGASRTVIFSGDPSAGAAAAAEYFSSPSHMRDLKRRLAKEGYAHFPPSYQVVVRCRIDSNLPTSVSYEGHAVLH